MIPAIASGIVAVLVLAYFLGRRERKRVGQLVFAEKNAEDVVAEPITVKSEQLASVATGSGLTPATPPIDGGSDLQIGGDDHEVSDFADLPTDAQNHLHRPKARPKLVWLNFALTAAVMTVLVWGIVEPPVILMIGVGLALVINFPRVAQQADQLKAHASSVVSVVALVFAASVLTGVLNGTGMVEAMATWLVDIIPTSFGPHLAPIAGVLSLPLTFFMSNDAFFFGVLPVLTKAASHYGITAEEMARAGIIGQPLHTSSPLVASFLLLVGLAKVELGDHMRKALWRACVVGLVMLTVGALTTAFPF
jgi:CitMHS family citrate-Mg2+:H+ or citrate-Ca2+:H+ symporter